MDWPPSGRQHNLRTPAADKLQLSFEEGDKMAALSWRWIISGIIGRFARRFSIQFIILSKTMPSEIQIKPFVDGWGARIIYYDDMTGRHCGKLKQLLNLNLALQSVFDGERCLMFRYFYDLSWDFYRMYCSQLFVSTIHFIKAFDPIALETLFTFDHSLGEWTLLMPTTLAFTQLRSVSRVHWINDKQRMVFYLFYWQKFTPN